MDPADLVHLKDLTETNIHLKPLGTGFDPQKNL